MYPGPEKSQRITAKDFSQAKSVLAYDPNWHNQNHFT